MQCLYRMSRAIAAAPGLEAVCDRLLAEAVRVIPVTKASIMKYDPVDKTLRIVAARGIPRAVLHAARVRVGEGISGRVFASSRPLLVKDVRTLTGVRSRRRYRGRSLIAAPVTCVPLRMGTTPVGVINMTDKRDGTPFTPRDLELLTTVANQVASYLHLCDLAAEVATARKTDQELVLAREIQQRLFPARRKRGAGYEMAGACLMSARVGGDYFDYLGGDGMPPALVIADISGHNVAAAITMAGVRSALRAEAASPLSSAAEIVERLNRIVYADLVRAEQFVSLVYLQYHARSSFVRWCAAGHPAPLHYRAARRMVALLGPGDGLVGLEAEAHFAEQRLAVARGDCIVLYTDGLVGARDAHARAFGLQRLRLLVARLAHGSPATIVRGVMAAVQRHIGSAVLTDDATVAVLKIR